MSKVIAFLVLVCIAAFFFVSICGSAPQGDPTAVLKGGAILVGTALLGGKLVFSGR